MTTPAAPRRRDPPQADRLHADGSVTLHPGDLEHGENGPRWAASSRSRPMAT